MEKFVQRDYKASDIKITEKVNKFDRANLLNCSKKF